MTALAAALGASSAGADLPAMARQQLFFVGSHANQPVLLAVVLQWRPSGAGAIIESKAFLAWAGRWKPPFYDRVTVDRWPGSALGPTARAWAAAARRPKRVRVGWVGGSDGFRLSIRRPAGALALTATGLRPAGTGVDPHGTVSWRAGPATLRVNGVDLVGVVISERLRRVREPWPRFGRFEMWLGRTAGGDAVLGRCHFRSTTVCLGSALVVTPTIAGTRTEPLRVGVPFTRRDPVSGFELPKAWSVQAPSLGALQRAGGTLGRGQAPDGGPAVYDISFAHGPKGSALVFHLQDRPN